MKLRWLSVGVVFAAIMLAGCSLLPPAPAALELHVTPNTGYPPLAVTLTAVGMTGGQYSFAVEGKTYQQSDNKLVIMVELLPCDVEVTWTGTGGPLIATATIGLMNVGPVVMRPVFNGITSLWILLPYARHVVTFPDTYDPEGGAVTLVSATVFNNAQRKHTAVFAPPYLGMDPPKPDVYRVLMPTGEIVENAFVFHSHWPVIIQSDSALPYSPPGYPEANYPSDEHGCIPEVAWPRGNIPSGDTVITVTFADEQDARTTESWAVPTGFYTNCGSQTPPSGL